MMIYRKSDEEEEAVAKRKGILFILSGPSGVGKDTVLNRVFEEKTDISYSISATTRDKRQGEEDGVHYFYKEREEFELMIEEGELLEYAQYVNNYYGTPKQFVVDQLEKGIDVFLEIEVQGAKQVKENFDGGVFIFLAPPSLKALEERIRSRGTEEESVVQSRLEEARKELKQIHLYDYMVINKSVNQATVDIQSIMTSEHLRRDRMEKEYESLLEE